MPLTLIPALHRATHRVDLYLAELREHGLSQGEAHILANLAQAHTATVGELHRSLAHRRSTLTSILDRLVERRLVTRQAGETDRRTFVVELTAKGKRVSGQIHRHLMRLENAARKRVSAAAIDDFIAVLGVIEDAAALPRSSRSPYRSR